MTHNPIKPDMRKIIIYNISENIDVPDISVAISEKIKDSIPNSNFIKKFNCKTSDNYNFLIEVPHCIADILVNAISVEINESVCYIKKFINITQCFVCQKYGHQSKSCSEAKVCAWCGESHKEKKKCNNSPKCINYAHNNEHYRYNFNISHPVFSSSYSSLKFYILQRRLQSHTKSNSLLSFFNVNNN